MEIRFETDRRYKVVEIKYIVDDCDEQFYQVASLQAEE